MATEQPTTRGRPARGADPGCRGPRAATIRRLHAEAKVAEAAPELRRARAQAARGDPAWRGRLEAYDHGETLILTLTARAVIDDATGAQPAAYCHEAVWVPRATAPRALTDRLREVALRHFKTVAAALRDRGIQIGGSEGQITVELLVDAAVTAGLSAPPEHDSDDASDPTPRS